MPKRLELAVPGLSMQKSETVSPVPYDPPKTTTLTVLQRTSVYLVTSGRTTISSTPDIPELLNLNGTKASTSAKKANLLNDFFTSCFTMCECLLLSYYFPITAYANAVKCLLQP